MISLHFSSVDQMRAEMSKLLGVTPSQVSAPTVAPGPEPSATPHAPNAPAEAAAVEGRDNAPAPVSTAEAEQPKRRGRPPKNPQAPAGAPVEAAQVSSSPPVAPAEAKSDEPASAGAPTPTDFAGVKALLAEVAALDNGAGLRDATAIIHEFGYAQVKAIQPEHYDAIAQKCRDRLAKK